jgi:hypothetical protein
MRIRPGFVSACPVGYKLRTSIVSTFDLGSHVVRYVPLDGVLHWIVPCQTSYKFGQEKWEEADMNTMHNLW